jgi:ribosomal protein S18 acetylase RimI-like enzyme
MNTFNINNKSFAIREFDVEKDSVEELTNLLHRAYKRLADMGLRFVATYQDDEQTKKRMKNGECFIIKDNNKIIATVMLYNSYNHYECEWYQNQGVAVFGQFAVEPSYQNIGIGSSMMSFLEERAKQNGADELALDTSEKAQHLIDYYKKRGYRFIQFHKWNVVNYRSVIMSKKL